MKFFYYILIGLMCCSCDLLDVVPENSVTYTNYFTSEEELESVITHMMGTMRTNLFDAKPHEQMGSIADELQTASNHVLSPTLVGNYRSDWAGIYDIIYAANVLLDNLHRTENVSTERIGFYEGQANFGKGISYLFLSRRWGEAVITDNSTNLTAYGKSPKLAVIDTAISCGLTAWRLLPKFEDLRTSSNAAITSKQYGCKGSAAALLAHAYAWKGSLIELYDLEGDAADCYEQAIYYASQIINGEAGNYSLLDPEVLCQTMSRMRSDNAESIFEIETDEISSSFPQFMGMASYYASWPVNRYRAEGAIATTPYRIYTTTVDEMYSDTDLRKAAFFYHPEQPIQTRYVYPYKFREGYYVTSYGYTYWQCLNSNMVYWRLSGIQLLRAECYAKLDNALAIADLNTIRSKANAAAYPAAGETDIQLAIFREREKELLFEDHRYYDVVRNGKEYIRRELDNSFTVLTDQDILDGALFLPVYTTAFTNNDRMRQNIYWSRITN